MRGRSRGQSCANQWQFYCGVPQWTTNPPTTKTKRGGAVTNTHFVFQPQPAKQVLQSRTTIQSSTRGDLDQLIRNEDVSASGGSGGAGGHGEGFFLMEFEQHNQDLQEMKVKEKVVHKVMSDLHFREHLVIPELLVEHGDYPAPEKMLERVENLFHIMVILPLVERVQTLLKGKKKHDKGPLDL